MCIRVVLRGGAIVPHSVWFVSTRRNTFCSNEGYVPSYQMAIWRHVTDHTKMALPDAIRYNMHRHIVGKIRVRFHRRQLLYRSLREDRTILCVNNFIRLTDTVEHAGARLPAMGPRFAEPLTDTVRNTVLLQYAKRIGSRSEGWKRSGVADFRLLKNPWLLCTMDSAYCFIQRSATVCVQCYCPNLRSAVVTLPYNRWNQCSMRWTARVP